MRSITVLMPSKKRIDGRSSSRREELISQLIQKALVTVEKFKSSFERSWDFRRLVIKTEKHTKSENIRFDGFSRAMHVTDATDWRVHYPLWFLFPDSESEIPGLVQACISLGLTIVPRGAGTGYTGGAVPLHEKSVVINTEKLNAIAAPEMVHLRGRNDTTATIYAQAGAVNKQVADKAAKDGWILPLTQTLTTLVPSEATLLKTPVVKRQFFGVQRLTVSIGTVWLDQTANGLKSRVLTITSARFINKKKLNSRSYTKKVRKILKMRRCSVLSILRLTAAQSESQD